MQILRSSLRKYPEVIFEDPVKITPEVWSNLLKKEDYKSVTTE
jgi:hypothetical protein